ncbi:LysM peptidoglycan-binding domain-containing protein [Phycisphaerales bacterium AB-hyl4]|uniref:LysM peptidoglycan-binding domain-containing protein n=1 Tax=Natronomicrosphaera hydrolytica TaxID=3242702 RepID=A0ABV4U499_9BACT
MTRETKVGLLIGMGVILLIGIIVSDTLSVARQGPADLADHGDRSQDSIFRPGPGDGLSHREQLALNDRADREMREQRRDPLPASEDAETRRRRAAAEQAEAQRRAAAAGRQLPTALSLDDGRSAQTSRRAAEPAPEARESRDVPSINLSHDWIFHTPEPVEPDEPRRDASASQRVAEAEPTSPAAEVSRVDTAVRSATPTRAAAQVTHEVQRGESLYVIARNYYGSGEYWRRIAEANPDTVGSEGRVSAGTELVIPDRSSLTLRDAGFEPVGTERAVRVEDVTRSRSQQQREIEVGSGDTLSGLAARHLGSASRWRELLEANSDKLDSDTALRAGMTLKLPSGSAAGSGGSSASRDSGRSSGGSSRQYTVRGGDSLTRIAQRELGDGERWRDIYDANRDQLPSPDSLRVGQTLRLP